MDHHRPVPYCLACQVQVRAVRQRAACTTQHLPALVFCCTPLLTSVGVSIVMERQSTYNSAATAGTVVLLHPASHFSRRFHRGRDWVSAFVTPPLPAALVLKQCLSFQSGTEKKGLF